jgi:hypothetical protein
MAKYRPRRLYSMPVQPIFEHPAYISLPVAGRGMIWSLFEHYWRTECRPLPIADDQLFAIVRAHRPTWRHWRGQILGIFNDVSPTLATAFENRKTGAATLRIVAWRGGETATAARKHARLVSYKPPTDSPANVAPVLPTKDPEKARPMIKTAQNKPERPKVNDAA